MSTSFRIRSDSGLSSSGPADDLGDDVEDDVQCDVGDDVEDDVELWRTTWRTTWPSLEDDVAEASVFASVLQTAQMEFVWMEVVHAVLAAVEKAVM